MKNVNFETVKPCGGDTIDARNKWCTEKCQTVGYQEAEYMFCLK